MPAARYWRIVGLEVPSVGDLALGDLQLHGAAGRLDAGVVPTSTFAPSAGSLDALADDDRATVCRFAGADVSAPGFRLVWDFGGTAVEALGIRFSSPDLAMSLVRLTLEWSQDGMDWTQAGTVRRWLGFPGALVLSPFLRLEPVLIGDIVSQLRFEGTAVVDDAGIAWSSTGPAISTEQSKFGASSLKFDTGRFSTSANAGFDFGIADYTLQMWVYLVARNATSAVLLGSGGGAWFGGESIIRLEPDGTILAYTYWTGPPVVQSSAAIPLNAWTHLEIGRADRVTRLFLNGSLNATYASGETLSFANTGSTYLGSSPLGETIKGYLDSVRVVKGQCLHTASFTTPAYDYPGEGLVTPALRSRNVQPHRWLTAPVPPHSVRKLPSLRKGRDMEFGGRLALVGTTAVKATPSNLPMRARVRILRERDGLLVGETWSDAATGAWSLAGLDASQQYIALAQDPAGNYRATAADRLVPEALP